MAVRPRLSLDEAMIGAAAVVLAAVGAFVVVRLAGTPSPFNHLGYVSILLAATLFGWRGGVASALLVAALLGPVAMMLSLPGEVEGPDAWLIRGVFYIGVGGLTGALFDRLRNAVTTVAARDHELRAIVESTSDALLVADDDRRYVAANPAACQLFGLNLAELLGRRIDDFLPGADAGAIDAMWAEFLEEGAQRGELTFRRPDGVEIAVDFAATARHLPGRHLSILRDITERRANAEQLKQLELFDALTKLPNATLLRDRLRIAVRQGRQAGTEVGLVHFGINGFKAMNEALGRSTGDRVLQVITDRIMAVTREGDSVGRVGGDEFVVVLGDPIDADGAWQAAGRILLAIAEPMEISGAETPTITLEASGGLAIFPSDADDEGGLLRAADLALHSAKRRGVGLAVYTDGQDAQARERWARLMELREALTHDQLILHYQPVFQARSLELISAEALVRWRHPTAGLLAPQEFIPLAEQAGLIDDLSLWVVREAVRQASRWASDGTPLVTAINLSPLNLRDSSIIDYLVSVLDEADLDAALFKIEITESAIVRADEGTMRALAGLRELGVRVAIDDFGTGYSSLGSLRSLPVDEIKLDRTFIGGMQAGAADRHIVRSIINLAHGLGLEVVAEGVEDQETLALLREMDCDAIQGYLTGRPVPVDDFVWPGATTQQEPPRHRSAGAVPP